MMLALTVRQPWAWAIIHGDKDVENRTWSTDYRGRLAIHAGKARAVYDPQVGIIDLDTLVYGAIIGTVEVIDCVRNHRSKWAERGCYHWLLANPRPLRKPIPYRGQQGLFHVDI